MYSRRVQIILFVGALSCPLSTPAPASDGLFGDLFKQIELVTFCDKHHGHPRCKNLEELRAFCAVNPTDTTRCHTSAAQAMVSCDSQNSEDHAYCAGLLDAQLDSGAVPQFGPPHNLFGPPDTPDPALRCVPAAVGRQPEQVRILFVREAYQHPEMLHLPMRQILFSALAKAFPCSSQPDDWFIPPEPKAKQAPAPARFGTAFFVEDGMALTNAHVVDGCSIVSIGSPEQMMAAQVIARDEGNDLALLRTAMHPAALAALKLSVLQGEAIATYGYPFPGMLASGGNLTTGNVSALSGIRDDSRLLQMSAPVQPGNSGGPLLDSGGNVVGVVVSKLDAMKIATALGDVPQNVNFAIKASVIAIFLSSNDVHFVTHEAGGTRSPAEIAEIAKRFTVQVRCGGN